MLLIVQEMFVKTNSQMISNISPTTSKIQKQKTSNASSTKSSLWLMKLKKTMAES